MARIYHLVWLIPFKVYLVVLFLLYLFTRLYNLTILPIFTDESIYIYWAKIIATEHKYWFISLTDGKPPLLIWMMALLLKILPSGWYLVAGRLPSVFAGVMTISGVLYLSWLLFRSRTVSLLAGLLAVFFPFSLLYERMALFDSLLQAMVLWSVAFAVKTGQERRKRDAVFWGVFLGLSLLSKPTAILFALLTPFYYWLTYRTIKKKNHVVSGYVKFLLPVMAIGIGLLIDNAQRLSSVYFLMDRKNQQFRQPISEIIRHPAEILLGNLHGFLGWIVGYYSIIFVGLGCVAFFFLIYKARKQAVILLSAWVVPLLALSLAGREIFPRYILFTSPYMIIAFAYFIGYAYVRMEKVKSLVLTLVVFWMTLVWVHFDWLLLTNPANAPIPETDYNQYIAEHPSGYGLDKVFGYINKQAENGPVTIVTQGTFGLYPYAFQLEYWHRSDIRILPRWPLSVIDQDIIDAQKTSRVLIVLKENQRIPVELPVTELMKAEKPGGRFPIYVVGLKLE